MKKLAYKMDNIGPDQVIAMFSISGDPNESIVDLVFEKMSSEKEDYWECSLIEVFGSSKLVFSLVRRIMEYLDKNKLNNRIDLNKLCEHMQAVQDNDIYLIDFKDEKQENNLEHIALHQILEYFQVKKRDTEVLETNYNGPDLRRMKRLSDFFLVELAGIISRASNLEYGDDEHV